VLEKKPEMPRFVAWKILRSGSDRALRNVDSFADARELSDLDRGLVRKLVGTAVRRRATLQALQHHLAPGVGNADLAAHLHIALVQIFFLDRIPEHAVRSTTNDAVRRSLGPSKVRVASEMLDAAYALREDARSGDPRRDLELRNVSLREPVFHDPREHPLLWAEEALSMPAALIKRWSARFGEERAHDLARFALEEPPLSLRVARGAREQVAAELAALEVTTRDGVHQRVLLAAAGDVERVVASPAFVEGRITVQGETALRAAEALEARGGETILDLCAAPGGKTAVIAASGANVVACDVSDEKLARVADTLTRLQLRERVELVRADRLEARGFDAVLVDAPCTNTGVLAQRPEARWRFSPQTKRELVALQTQLLARGAESVRPGGRLVWSTCALDSDENRRAVDLFLARHPQWTLEVDAESLPDCATTQTRGAGPIDGGYFARLRRPAATTA
jgi:16S rRNA (cytosine967-C5)-methyltransferase